MPRPAAPAPRLAAWTACVLAIALVGCSQHTRDGSTGTSDGSGSREAGGDGDTGITAGEPGGDMASSGSGSTGGSGSAGVLTAGAWDDNLNFDFFMTYRTGILGKGVTGAPGFTVEEHEESYSLFAPTRPANTTLDIALVIDTTGSMSDEIAFLQEEFRAIATQIAAAYPGASQRWALILYRDEGDEYVVRTFDFDTDIEVFRSNLAAQSAGGGGDFPEAAHSALLANNDLAWRTDDATARLAFWVADAPHHDEQADAMATAIRASAAADVHIYPIASSGIDDLTELTMRSAAQITGGRYLFLTDDSGVGNAHVEPSIPCYFVTRLDDALLRMVDIEMSGTYREPAAEDILRTGGDPTHGSCTLEDGEVVQVF